MLIASGGAVNPNCTDTQTARNLHRDRGSKPVVMSHQRIAPYTRKIG